jgi:hypothetical protein
MGGNRIRRIGAAAFALAALGVVGTALAQGKAQGRLDLVKRGEYLVNAGGCNDCHTPWTKDPQLGILVPDTSRKLIGHPQGAPGPAGTVAGEDVGVIGPTFTSFRLAFGVVYAANLTPDDDTGIGRWTEEQFIRAMRTGWKMGIAGGAPVLPPMPWPNLAALTDEDLRAIFAYLRSLPPVANAVPANEVQPEAVKQIAQAYEAMGRAHAAPTRAGRKPPR